MKYIITGGGTGGHIYSAIATADEIKRRQPDAEIIFVGSKYYMETGIVPKAGYSFKAMPIRRWNRFGWWKNYKFPFEVLASLWQSFRLINSFKPDAVIGTGGFATGPVLKVAQWKGIPTFIQEHNAYPGITTRLLAHKATRVHTAYKAVHKYLKTNNKLLVGNPVRQDLVDNLPSQNDAKKAMGLDNQKQSLVIIGGSRGAAPVNEIIIKILPELKKRGIQTFLQTGKKLYEPYKNIKDEAIIIVPFVDDMPTALAAADVIISRAGAMTIAELALVGKPGILIPDTFSEQGHQDHNAEALANEQAGIYIQEKDMEQELLPAIIKLFDDKSYAGTLAANIKKFAFPNATKNIVDDIFSYLKKNNNLS